MCANRPPDHSAPAVPPNGDGLSHDHGHDQSQGHSGPGVQPSATDAAECPVMPGSFVNKDDTEDEGLVREYQGKKYYLCCDSCGPLWDADPARYAQST